MLHIRPTIKAYSCADIRSVCRAGLFWRAAEYLLVKMGLLCTKAIVELLLILPGRSPARPGAITLSRRSLSASISCLMFEAPKMQVAITPWGQINPKVRLSLRRGGLSLVGPRIRRALRIFYNPQQLSSVIVCKLFLLLPIILICILTY